MYRSIKRYFTWATIRQNWWIALWGDVKADDRRCGQRGTILRSILQEEERERIRKNKPCCLKGERIILTTGSSTTCRFGLAPFGYYFALWPSCSNYIKQTVRNSWRMQWLNETGKTQDQGNTFIRDVGRSLRHLIWNRCWENSSKINGTEMVVL